MVLRAAALRAAPWLAALLCCRYLLPLLANLTPPGVSADPPADARQARTLSTAAEKCSHACDGLRCPDGWQTVRDPADECKCICSRSSPGVRTQWDEDRARRIAAEADAASRPGDDKPGLEGATT